MKIISRQEAKAQGLKRYYTGQPCKHGHVDERLVSNGSCFGCGPKKASERLRAPGWESRLEDRRQKYQENRDRELERKRRYREANREKHLESTRRWRKESPDKYLNGARRYREENPEAVRESQRRWCELNRHNLNDYRRERLRSDPAFRMAKCIRDCIRRTVKNKSAPSVEMIGYTPDELRAHIERQFIKGMSWENYGEWHIDHICPVSKMIAEGVTDPAVINCLSNLRPMWAADNMSKGDRQTHLL